MLWLNEELIPFTNAPGHSWMAYASPEYAKIPYIREWHMPFVNEKALIREWDKFVVGPEQI